MRTRRIIVVLAVIAISITSLFAGSANRQKIYRVDSSEYEDLKYLYIMTGHSLPSTTGPWSEDELSRMLAKIDRSSLTGSAASLYDNLDSVLNQERKELCDGFAIRWGLDVDLENYIHSNTNDNQFIGRSNWNYSFLNHKPFLNIKLETWPISSFYGYSELSLQNYVKTKDGSLPEFGETVLTTNFPAYQNPPVFTLNVINVNIPYRAFAAAGGNHWSLQIGRDRMSWGPGKTGNFVVGDNIEYHNMARFTTYFDSFKYTFVSSFFPHPSLYASDDPASWGFGEGGQEQLMNGINMFMAHRLEFRFFKDRMNFVLTEAVMYQSEENHLDLQVFNPCMLFHNYYIKRNANSILSLELDYTPFRNLNIYAQIVIDEYALPGERVPGKDDGASPEGRGFMAGVNAAFPLSKGVLYGSVEGAYTDPYLYLRDKGSGEQAAGDYGISWVVAVRNYCNDPAGGNVYDESFLGYKYGGDAIVANLNAGYRSLGRWHAEGNLFYMAHGTFDKWTCWKTLSAGEKTNTPTTSHPNANNKDPNANSTRNAVSHTFVCGVNTGFEIIKGLESFIQADLITIWNPGNIRADKPITDFQLTVGIGYSL